MAKQDTSKETPMQLAEILSDLVSLRVCDPSAALALVSARSSTTSTTTNTSQDKQAATEEQDPELKRAKDLLKLHYEVKEAHKRGQLGRGLEEARWAVGRAVGGGGGG